MHRNGLDNLYGPMKIIKSITKGITMSLSPEGTPADNASNQSSYSTLVFIFQRG